ncbi:dihydrodipicolinate synthase family protein [Raoultella ornithinolytica]|uniref:dihydrodipicolinate synthase family protein n=1 Tax=Raoultella ornithinolytica TaxID=54291 RepID=UPI000E597901|nr:dihydrodipicolinate synthase family protein [Raoultella ornithinolytica]EKV6723814.1 dihydrodipicolinate synthase family protein [Raoultella ornithinolytica]ELH1434682.1 dihydrodipicolinate synthase family protein [Raoultella ornithinolytica]MCE9803266.1 dihydrodipicolinate synthase family protein [Raoultella ornithinolytica]MCE9812988.1 dihydrodipicolinate synthase family protein [Raoultella ornithinolytica]MCE9867278.1 dihydrodipicolinate synthase family protein [Raoultella ornithinolytic
MLSIHLPTPQGIMTNYPLVTTEERPTVITPAFNRIAYAAAHVVIDPQHQGADWLNNPRIDWDATLAYRHHLWRLGFNIAEAMDTAQRGMGVSWEIAKELIIRSLQEAQTVPGADLAAGVGTDQLEAAHATTLEQVIAAYEEQMELVEQHNGKIILMASRALAKVAKTPQDYLAVYNRLLEQSQDKIILHWLGEMFDPALAGYWGSTDFAAAADTVLEIIANNVDKVEGIKISLLSKEKEVAFRKRLPSQVKMYTGDDFNYPELIAGEDGHYSHALLGIFDAIAPVAAAALNELALGNSGEYYRLMNPTVALSREIFKAPTQYYKAGIVFLAWLNGHQSHFSMAGGMQAAREISHYAEIFRLADQAGLLQDPQLATRRMKNLLTIYGL